MEIRYGRKKSGIKKELKIKLDEWVESMDDLEIQDLCRKNTIVTGGSIASMLLGEPVNDYDVYFKTKECAMKVASYYIQKFKEIKKDQNPYCPNITVQENKITNILGIEEERVVIVVKSAGIAEDEEETSKIWRGEGIEQEENFDTAEKPKYRPIFLSQNAITLSDKFQIIIRFFGEPEKIHDNYDFEHAMNYYDYYENKLVLKLEALECLLSRTLIYRGSLYPIASIFRMKKFIERGWRISAGEQLKIMWQISEVDLTKPETLMEQLTGVDMLYMKALIEALHGVDPEKITSAYVSKIIDKIFD